MASDSLPSEINVAPFKQGFAAVENGVKLCYYTNFHGSSPSSNKPILLLLHGYPQSSFMWRHVAPKFSEADYPVFVFDLPGYGNSRDLKGVMPQDKLSTGSAILNALASILPTSSTPHSLILVCHDRGARVAHRLAVSRSSFPSFNIKAVCLMDIVPITVQYAAFGKAKEVVTYWHWPFLANVEFATELIMAYGGTKWLGKCLGRIAGKDSAGESTLYAGNAVEVYGAHFENEDVVRATCRDYEAGASVDLERQAEDQKAGKKIDIPTLIIFSAAGLGSRFDVEGIWKKDWIKEGVKVEAFPVGNDVGHYVAEEGPDDVGPRVLKWLEGF